MYIFESRLFEWANNNHKNATGYICDIGLNKYWRNPYEISATSLLGKKM